MEFLQKTAIDAFVKQLDEILKSHIKDKDTEIRKFARRLYNSGYSEGYRDGKRDLDGY